MTPFKRIIPLLLTAILSACIELPEIAEPETPADAGTQPDGGGAPDGGGKPDSGVPTDTTSPTITETSPTHNSTQVLTGSAFIVTFSEPMDVSTVQVSTAPTLALSPWTWASGDTQLTLQPTSTLAQNTTYTFFVDGKDRSGNLLSGRKAFSFSTTGPAPDTTPPTVLSATPSHSAVGVARNAAITVAFSEPMDKASAQTAFAITSPPGFNAGVFDWNAEGTQMTFNPDADFPYGTEVAWRISTTATDPSANPLETTVTGTFRAIRISTVTINYDPPTSGSGLGPDYWRQTYVFFGAAVGDYGQTTSDQRLLLGFKLEALPEDLTLIKNCKIKWRVSNQAGSPFAKLGRLLLERVYIGEAIALSDATSTNPVAKTQYEAPSLGPAIIIASSTISTITEVDVTSFVTSDWAERAERATKRSQFRLRFETPNNGDTVTDAITTQDTVDTLAELELTYEYP